MHRSGLFLLAFLSFTVFAVGAQSSEKPAAHGADNHAVSADPHAAADGHAHAAGNPILDLAIWTVLVFVLLMFILGKFAWKPMLAGLQQREASIRGALEEAEKAREEAQAMRVNLQKEMADAHLKVKGIIDEGKRDAQLVADDLLAKAKADIGAERERMHREIQVATDQATQALWARTAELATEISAKALGKQIDGAGHRRLIDEAMKDLQQSGANGHA
jgi:F-type H+-transporting ATPase subunit b